MTPRMPHPDADHALRAAGLRVTRSRRAVYDALRGNPHASADDLHALAGTSSTQTVYNALADFTAAGLVRRIEPSGSPMLFELRVEDNHHHLVCRRCGRVEDVDCAVGDAPCLEPAQTHGFAVDTAEVTYWGVCASCADSPPRPRTEGTP